MRRVSNFILHQSNQKYIFSTFQEYYKVFNRARRDLYNLSYDVGLKIAQIIYKYFMYLQIPWKSQTFEPFFRKS